MTVQIKEIKQYTNDGLDAFVALYIGNEKVSCKKDYCNSIYELSSEEKAICRCLPNYECKEEIKLYKEISGTKEEIITAIQNIGYDNSRIEDDFILCVENAE